MPLYIFLNITRTPIVYNTYMYNLTLYDCFTTLKSYYHHRLNEKRLTLRTMIIIIIIKCTFFHFYY